MKFGRKEKNGVKEKENNETNRVMERSQDESENRMLLGRRNKAGYTAIQLWTPGQEQYCKNRSEFKNVTYRPTDQHGKV